MRGKGGLDVNQLGSYISLMLLIQLVDSVIEAMNESASHSKLGFEVVAYLILLNFFPDSEFYGLFLE